jgi:hypothetical protein
MKIVFFLVLFLACVSQQGQSTPNRTDHLRGKVSPAKTASLVASEHGATASGPLGSGDQPMADETPRNFSPVDVALFGFGIVMVLICIALSAVFPEPTSFQLFVFRVVLALGVGAIGVALPGFISLSVGNGTRATGGAALFLIIYAYNPAKLFRNAKRNGDRGKEPVRKGPALKIRKRIGSVVSRADGAPNSKVPYQSKIAGRRKR